MSWDLVFGLWLNIERIRFRDLSIVLQAIGGALSHEPLPRGYYDALSLTPGEVDEAEFAGNWKRQLAGLKAQVGK